MPVIRVDADVYGWLQGLARPFEDSPNSVLRRVAGLGNPGSAASTEPESEGSVEPVATDSGRTNMSADVGERVTGAVLARRWGVSVRHALYHKDGTWYNNLQRFPGGLFDPDGYVVFKSLEEYQRCPQISIGEETNVRPHLSAIAGYVRMPRKGP